MLRMIDTIIVYCSPIVVALVVGFDLGQKARKVSSLKMYVFSSLDKFAYLIAAVVVAVTLTNNVIGAIVPLGIAILVGRYTFIAKKENESN